MAWKLSVADIYTRMNRVRSYVTEIDVGVAAGGSTFLTKGDQMSYVFGRGDILKLGPSTAVGYEGKIELVKIDYALKSPFAVYINDPATGLVNDYADGDSVQGVGSLMLDSWKIQEIGSPDSSISMLGLVSKRGASGAAVIGYMNDLVSQKLALLLGTTGQYFFAKEYKNKFLVNTYYRVGALYKATGLVGNPYIALAQSLASNFAHAYLASGASSTWTKTESGGTSSLSVSDENQLRFVFSALISETLLEIGLAYGTHASGTSAESSGVYTFPVNAFRVSELLDVRTKTIEGRYGGTLDYGPLSMGRKDGYRALFIEADAAFVRTLEMFQYWQEIGNVLMLETDFEDRSPLFGFMDFRLSYEHWDDNLVTVDFMFRGE